MAQKLTFDPDHPITGRPVTVTLSAPDRPMQGAVVRIVWEQGDPAENTIGTTGADGRLVWKPQRDGTGELRCEVAGVAYVAPIVVNHPPSVLKFIVPWSFAALILLWISVKASRRQRERA